MILRTVMYQTYLNNRVLDYLIWCLVFFVSVAAVIAVKRMALAQVKVWADKTETTIDDFLVTQIEKSLIPVLYFGALYLSIRVLAVAPAFLTAVNVAGMAVFAFFGSRFLMSSISYSLASYAASNTGGSARAKSIKGVEVILKTVVGGIAAIILLDNLGVKISGLIAGLGIGGVAVALASQAILGDLFSYFVILFDCPFELGDFIIIGENMGTVERIGIKTTRIRSLGGEQLVLSNTLLTGSQLRNYKRMEKRRVVFKLRVTYQTDHARLTAIPVIIKDIVAGTADAVFDRAHFFSYGDFALIYEIVYYVVGSDYNKFMDIQQAINLKIKEEFEKRSIEFAYPTQTLYVAK